VIDRLVAKGDNRRRLTDSMETALKFGEGVAQILVTESDDILTFSQFLACSKCGESFEKPEPKNFSFNSPYGACVTCDGLGQLSKLTLS